jgi:hypothetical protein
MKNKPAQFLFISLLTLADTLPAITSQETEIDLPQLEK